MLHPLQGWGLGLRTRHYPDFLGQRQPLDWLEVITDNYLVEGGRPLQTLDKIRQDYPVVMHGVAMSIGRVSGLDTDYLARVKHLADRVHPLWISDHLCWTAPPGSAYLHDLFPLPYTDESARLVIEHIRQVQDVLQRRFVVENVSSYLSYRQSVRSEWDFLYHIAQEADCLLLLDVNNIYVSSVNHDFNPMDYLRALPAGRIQQIHLAGHTTNENLLIDTHDQPVPDAVWNLYAKACGLFGAVPTMIERDDNIPELPELLKEVEHGRLIQKTVLARREQVSAGGWTQPVNQSQTAQAQQTVVSRVVATTNLATLQTQLGAYVLDRDDPQAIVASIESNRSIEASKRLHVYHYAYRARLTEVLVNCFPQTARYMGGEVFQQHAFAFVVEQPPSSRYLGFYGETLSDWLAKRYPEQLQLSELALIEWRLRKVFDARDQASLCADALDDPGTKTGALRLQQWLETPKPLHLTVELYYPITSNAAAIWRALKSDDFVPEVQSLPQPQTLMVWRNDLQPHFQTLNAKQAELIGLLATGHSLNEAIMALEAPPNQETLGQWLRDWLHEGVFADTLGVSGVNAESESKEFEGGVA